MAKRAVSKQRAAKGKKPGKKPGRKAPPRKPRPKQTRLEGMEDMPKDRVLDGVCSRLSEIRATINEAKQAEIGEKNKALGRMKTVGVDSYTAHGIQLVHTSLDKLSVKQVDASDADEGDEDEERDGEHPDAEQDDPAAGNDDEKEE